MKKYKSRKLGIGLCLAAVLVLGFTCSWKEEDQTQTIPVGSPRWLYPKYDLYSLFLSLTMFFYSPAPPLPVQETPALPQPGNQPAQPGQHHLQWAGLCKRVWAEGDGFLFLWTRFLQGSCKAGVRTSWGQCWHVLLLWSWNKPGSAPLPLSWVDHQAVPWSGWEGPPDVHIMSVCVQVPIPRPLQY